MTIRLADLFDLTGQVALITGGSRGLGLQMARALGQYGATVALVARKVADLDAAVAELRGEGLLAHAFPADLATTEAADQLVQAVLQRCGRIDILVNNAGASWGAPTEEHPDAGWDKVVAVNMTGLFRLTRAVGRDAMLPAGRGSIINIASIEGLFGHHHARPSTIGYNATKGAVVNMTRALAAEWGGRGIRVNAIAPGYFSSKMADVVIEHHREQLLDGTPLGKLGGDGDLMGATLLFASAAGGHITGQILAVDGGFTAI